MINVLEQIKPLMHFRTEDDFFHLQIIKRKKENPDLGSNSVVLKTHYITSVEHLEKLMPEMIRMATSENGRVMMNLNRRSFEKIAFKMLIKLAEQMHNNNYKSVKDAYESVCGKYNNESEKKWIIDIDEKNLNIVEEVQQFILGLDPQPVNPKFRIKELLETKNGWHLITSPFRLDTFKKKFPEIDVHKDNPVNIFVP